MLEQWYCTYAIIQFNPNDYYHIIRYLSTTNLVSCITRVTDGGGDNEGVVRGPFCDLSENYNTIPVIEMGGTFSMIEYHAVLPLRFV